jgi:hypothetical protein
MRVDFEKRMVADEKVTKLGKSNERESDRISEDRVPRGRGYRIGSRT